VLSYKLTPRSAYTGGYLQDNELRKIDADAILQAIAFITAPLSCGLPFVVFFTVYRPPINVEKRKKLGPELKYR